MPSYTEEQKRRAVDMVEGCGGSVTRAMRKLGYPTRQTLYQWLNQRDASHERRAGRPWSHYDPALKAQAVAFVRSGMAGKDVAEMLGVSSAAVVYNWARAAEDPSPAAADRSPIEPMRDSEDRAYDGFEGSLEERVRQLELENDILRAAAKVLKAESPSAMTNREKALVINELRATTGRSLRELTGSLRISKSSYEYQRRAMCFSQENFLGTGLRRKSWTKRGPEDHTDVQRRAKGEGHRDVRQVRMQRGRHHSRARLPQPRHAPQLVEGIPGQRR